MIKTTLKIDGMMCGMCESHINDTIRQGFKIKKVTSSHSKGTTEIISEDPLDEAAVKEAVDKTGYKVLEIKAEPYEKKRFSLFGRK
jgi:copper chaperone CopZ